MSSSGSGQIPNSGFGEDIMDQRKRRRMQSNRESARRSRMRKQKLMDDLTAQIDDLKKENSQILTGVAIATEKSLQAEAENSVLRAQVVELSHRLDSLNQILGFINTAQNEVVLGTETYYSDGLMTNSLSWMNMNQPLMANGHHLRF